MNVRLHALVDSRLRGRSWTGVHLPTNAQPETGSHIVVATFNDRAPAIAAIERLRRAGFTDEQLRFAMRGEYSPRVIATLGAGFDLTMTSSVGSSVGIVLGTSVGALAAPSRLPQIAVMMLVRTILRISCLSRAMSRAGCMR